MLRMIPAFLLTLLCVSVASAADWGDLKLKFVYDGKAPTAPAIKVTKDQAFCGKHNLKDESLVVGKDGALANVIVYLYVDRRGPKPTVHPDYAKTANDTIDVLNKNCRYDPHVVLVRTTQKVKVGNPDPIGHNTKVDTFANPPINPIIPAGGSIEQQFGSPERLPAKLSCSIHPWMMGWMVVQAHPYMGASDAKGEVTIKNLPAGKWTFQVWHEKAGYVQDVTIGGKKTSWRRGRPEFSIKSGMNDLGVVKIGAKAFEK